MRQATLATLAMLLCSCMGAKPPPHSWQQQQQQIKDIQQWRLQGRISARYSDQAVLANVDWQQSEQDLLAHFYGSFGLGTHELRYNQSGASLIDPEGNTHKAQSIEALMQKKLGWSTPLMFSSWVRGLPGVAPDEASYDRQGRLSSFSHKQWDVEYLEYFGQNDLYLPRKIHMYHANDISITVIIHNWEMGT